MSEALDRMAGELDRQIRRTLDALHTPTPRTHCIDQVKQAVTGEAAQLRHRARGPGPARRWVAAAAAVLLAVSLGRPPGLRTRLLIAADDPSETLSEWAQTVEESSKLVSRLFSEEWTPDDWRPAVEEERELEELFESLDESLALGV